MKNDSQISYVFPAVIMASIYFSIQEHDKELSIVS